jgi:hypothetical protein
MRLKDGDETAVDVRLDGSPQPRTLAIEKQPGEGGK